LFCHQELTAFLEGLEASAAKEVSGLKPDYLLSVSETDLLANLTAKYRIGALKLLSEQKSVEGPDEVPLTYPGFAYGEDHVTVQGTSVTVIVPFEGDSRRFDLRPTTWSTSPVRGAVRGREVHLTFCGYGLKGEQLKRDIDRTIADIDKHIAWQEPTIRGFDDRISDALKQAIASRRAKLNQDRALVASLQIPIRRRGVPDTFIAPVVRVRARFDLPQANAKPYTPEWTLAEDQYQFILKVIRDMAIVMERSPRAFMDMAEEHIRFLFLVPLNGHFEGAATGETFNYEGKTDILIRHEGRNVFIAECKFWRGEKEFSEAIDQLFRYTSWRDTKTAIIVFNKNKNFSRVLERIPGLVRTHPSFKREAGPASETDFRFVMHHPGDTDREVHLTVMAFDIPTQSQP
jgi:hypothetical protein